MEAPGWALDMSSWAEEASGWIEERLQGGQWCGGPRLTNRPPQHGQIILQADKKKPRILDFRCFLDDLKFKKLIIRSVLKKISFHYLQKKPKRLCPLFRKYASMFPPSLSLIFISTFHQDDPRAWERTLRLCFHAKKSYFNTTGKVKQMVCGWWDRTSVRLWVLQEG